MKHILLLLFCLAQPLLAMAQAEFARIEILVAADNAPSRDIAIDVQRALRQSAPGMEINLHHVDEYQNNNAQSTLVVAIGDSTLPWLTTRKNDYAGAIAFLTRAAEFRDEEKNNKKITAIFRDQPLSRQLQLSKLVVPDLRRVTIIRSERELAESISDLQRSSGLSITDSVIDTKSEWAKQLSQLMQNNDVLLGIDDSKIYNGDTIRSILLTTYRHGKGLIGPSRAFVNAGSLASCYTTSEQYLQQLVDTVTIALREHRLPPPQYPKLFQVIVNRQVAISLNLSIPDENTLSARLQNQNGECGNGC